MTEKSITPRLTPMDVFNTLENFIIYTTQRFDEIDKRFDNIEQILGKLDKLDKIDQTLTYHETWLQQIDEKLDKTATKKQLHSLVSILENKTILNRFEIDHVMSR